MLGPRAKTVVTALTGFFKNSKREAPMIIEEVLGTLSNTEHRVSLKCKKVIKELHKKIQSADLLRIDETEHRLQSKRGWAWVFANSKTTLILSLC